ncbi:TetR/AcrR family transcriptional regulator [Novosphingobium sp.]|uniref:TetR/AcrR family transcriptional regulator n=1 Tax=Novosphingobium sp. TaxID=1874826 RepID=UPI003BAC7030
MTKSTPDSKTPPRKRAKALDRTTYQHGDLPAALARAVLEIVAERGVKNISLAEAARRSGVSSGAPYRHYSSRDELVATIGVGIYRRLNRSLRAAREAAATGPEQLAAMARAYVEFSGANRAEVELLFQSGVSHLDYPELGACDAEAYAEYRSGADACGLDPARAHDLVFAAAAIAHGFATLEVAATANYAISRESAGIKAAEAVTRTVTGFLVDASNDPA